MATYIQIGSTVTVGSGGAANIDFTSIPSTYTDLVLKVSARTNRAATGDYVLAAFNGSTASFTNRILDGDGTNVNVDATARVISYGTGATATASTFANSEAYIPNYTSANSKTFSSDNVTENNATNAFADIIAGIWASSSAINQITLTPNVGTLFAQYTTASLYGILKSQEIKWQTQRSQLIATQAKLQNWN